jgi:hypothetical protein
MARLTASDRKKLPPSDFGLPGKRAYPMPNDTHARLAKSGASRAERVGNITPAQEKAIDAKADRVLGRGKKKPAAGAKPRWRQIADQMSR